MYIYKIVPKGDHTASDAYIGSTRQPLKVRFAKHKHDFKRWKDGRYNYVSSFYLFDKYGDDLEIIELENPRDITNEELRKREFNYIKDSECVNIHGKHNN